MKRYFNWLATILLVVSFLFVGCPQEVAIDTTAPADVTELRAETANDTVILTWTNPSDKDFNGVQIEMSCNLTKLSVWTAEAVAS